MCQKKVSSIMRNAIMKHAGLLKGEEYLLTLRDEGVVRWN